MKSAIITAMIIMTAFAEIPTEKIQKILDRTVDNKKIFRMAVAVSKDGETETFAAGDIRPDDQYFIASVSKLYTATIVMKLREEGRLNLDDYIEDWLCANTIDALHIYKGTDYSYNITIRQLLSNTSGLPDYFEQAPKGEKSLFDDLKDGNDRAMTYEQQIALSKTMTPAFPPGTKGKALYSDTNFQLLGRILENIANKSLADLYDEYIFTPLGLEKTYLYTDPTDTRPVDFYYKDKPLQIPQMMTSFRAAGGIVSTTEEGMIFLKAFFAGDLFPKEYLNEMTAQWNSIFPPFKYGTGIARFKFIGTYELIGHPGANGSFAYYCPKKDAYIVGSIFQADSPGLPYKPIMKILKKM